MQYTDTKRLRQVVNYLILNGYAKNMSELATKCGLNRSGFSDKMTGRRAMTSAFVSAICAQFPTINPDYLMKEECTEMLRKEGQSINVTGHGNQVAGHDLFSSFSPEVRQILSVYEAQLAQATQQIQTLSEQLAKSSEIIANLVKKQ